MAPQWSSTQPLPSPPHRMGDICNKASTQAVGCRAIGDLALSSEGCAKAIAAKRPEYIAEQLKKHGSSPDVAEQCARAFGIFASHGSAARQTVAAVGATTLVLKHMASHFDVSGVQEQGCFALAEACVDERQALIALDNDAATLVTKALANFAHLKELQLQGCRALEKLSLNGGRKEVVAAGGPAVALPALATFCRPLHIAEAAGNAVGAMVGEDESGLLARQLASCYAPEVGFLRNCDQAAERMRLMASSHVAAEETPVSLAGSLSERLRSRLSDEELSEPLAEQCLLAISVLAAGADREAFEALSPDECMAAVRNTLQAFPDHLGVRDCAMRALVHLEHPQS